MRKTNCLVFALCATFMLKAFAANAPAASDSPFTYNIGLASDYVFRGVTQTTHAPAIQGGIDYAHASGLYIGTWASNVKRIKDSGALATGDANVELDTYFGIRNEIVGDLGYDFGYIRYNYLGAYTPQVGYDNADTAEVYGAASYKFVTLKYSYSLLDGFFTTPNSKGTNYLDLSANYPVEIAGMTLGAHIGRQNIVGATADSYNSAGSSLSYVDYKLSASKDFNSYVLSLSYTNSNASSSFWSPGGDTWGSAATALSLTHSF